MPTPAPEVPPSRRGVLIGAGVAVLAAAGGFAVYATQRPQPAPVGTTGPTGTTSPATTGISSGSAGPTLAKVADIPENGGVVLADAQIVLTRTTGDAVKAFTAVCTHQGCIVATVSAGAIHCPCHGSAFDATTGAVVNGPATAALAPVAVTVTAGVVTKG